MGTPSGSGEQPLSGTTALSAKADWCTGSPPARLSRVPPSNNVPAPAAAMYTSHCEGRPRRQ